MVAGWLAFCPDHLRSLASIEQLECDFQFDLRRCAAWRCFDHGGKAWAFVCSAVVHTFLTRKQRTRCAQLFPYLGTEVKVQASVMIPAVAKMK
jgi:hypothetical protein